jgi:hypothetical protein
MAFLNTTQFKLKNPLSNQGIFCIGEKRLRLQKIYRHKFTVL